MHRSRALRIAIAVTITYTLVVSVGCGGDEPAPTTPDGSRVLAACGGAPRHRNLTAPCGPSEMTCTLHRDELVDPIARWRDGAPRVALDQNGVARVLYRDATDDDPRATFGSSAHQVNSGWQSERLPMDFRAAALSFDDSGASFLVTSSVRGGFEQWRRSETQWKRVESAGAFPGWSGSVARDGKGCLHTAAPAGQNAAYGVHVPGSAAGPGKSSWWFSSLGALEQVQLTLDERGAAHVAGWAQDDDGWHVAYVHAGRVERVSYVSGEATRGKVFIVMARDERHGATGARPHIVFTSSTSQPWGATTKINETLRLATRGDDGSWSVRELANTERAAGCNLTPLKSGERCEWKDSRLEPLAVLGGAGLRLVLAALDAEGRDYASCKYLGPGSYGECSWTRSPYAITETLSLEIAWLGADGELARDAVLSNLSSEHQLAAGSAALRGDARVDADGNIHIVFNDRVSYSAGSRVRYLQLRRL